jgi:hypothetical protein
MMKIIGIMDFWFVLPCSLVDRYESLQESAASISEEDRILRTPSITDAP